MSDLHDLLRLRWGGILLDAMLLVCVYYAGYFRGRWLEQNDWVAGIDDEPAAVVTVDSGGE